VARLFFKRLQGRSTLIVVLLVAVAMGVALATIRNGVSLGSITGGESTDDAYVRADQIAISSHIAGYVDSVPVQDNGTVKRGQLVATIRNDDYRAKVASAEAELEVAQSQVDVLSAQIRCRALTAQLADNRQALLEAQQRYRRGQVGLLAVLEDQQQLYATQDSQVTSTLTRCLADISLFKALGGNWQNVVLPNVRVDGSAINTNVQ
jgi:multidrug resistance efflux pump